MKTKVNRVVDRKAAKATDVGAELAAARTAIEAASYDQACRHLATAWFALPHPRLAAAAAAATKKISFTALPEKVAAREAAWLELAAKHDVADLPALLGTDWPVHPRAAKARLGHLVEFAPDPRISDAVLALYASKRYKSNAADAFWRHAFKLLLSWGEPRLGDLARAAKKSEDMPWWSIFQPLGTKQPWPAEPALPAAIATQLAAIEAALAAGKVQRPAGQREALFAAVYDDPASDGPREVLADFLIGEEDPRGELIQLQLSGKGGKVEARIKALLRTHQHQWLDGVDTRGDKPVFRRGFLAEATGMRIVADPPRAWRTIEKVGVPGTTQPELVAKFLLHDNLASVTSIDGASPAVVAKLAGKRYAHLGLHGKLAPIANGPEVRHVTLSWLGEDDGDAPAIADQLAWFAGTALARTAKELTITCGVAALATARAWFATSRLERLVLVDNDVMTSGWSFAITHPQAPALAMTWHANVFGEASPLDVIGAFDRKVFASIELASRVPLDAPIVAELEKAFGGTVRVTKK